jgi:transposase
LGHGALRLLRIPVPNGILSGQQRNEARVAMANKMARIAWAVMTRGEVFQPGHAPKPAA